MVRLLHVALFTSLLSMITACGGGGGAGENTTPGALPLVLTPTTEQEANYAYANLAENTYRGSTTKATLDETTTAYFIAHLLGDTPTPGQSNTEPSSQLETLSRASGLGRQSGNRRSSASHTQETIESETIACQQGGEMVLSADYAAAANGLISVDYRNCHLGGLVAQGKGHVLLDAASGEVKAQYYNAILFLDPADPSQSFLLSGYMTTTLQSDFVTNTMFVTLTFKESGEQVRMENFQEIIYYWNENTTLTGRYYIDQFGYIDVTTSVPLVKENEVDYAIGALILSGESSRTNITIQSSEYVKITLDQNADGVSDRGVVITGRLVWNTNTFLELTYVPAAEINSPPVAPYAHISSQGNGDTRDDLVAQSYGSYDEDGDVVIVIEYRWYINDSPSVAPAGSNIFPAYTAKAGDKVEVEVVVSDGYHQVVSPKASFIILDADGSLQISGLPDTVQPGQRVEFSATIIDPDDVDSLPLPAYLISGPAGASIDDSGSITWLTPASVISNSGQYVFTFSTFQDPSRYGAEVKNAVIQVLDSTDNQPVAASSIFIPARNQSMAVGDFDGENGNELLTTDNLSRVALVKVDDTGFTQKWLYPYAQINNEGVVQVQGFDIDANGKQDILVATPQQVAVIDPTTNTRTIIFMRDTLQIQSFAVADLAGDGNLKLAITAVPEPFYGVKRLYIVDLDSQSMLLDTPLSDATREIAIGNVDQDNALEVVTNDGFVFDGLSLLNQWYLGKAFGDSISVGDTDGDGIEEILGAHGWGAVQLFNAVEKTSLTVLPESNSCNAQMVNVDNDDGQELIVGDCQWGSMTAYKRTGNSFDQVFQVSFDGYGSISPVAGDVDNDGVNELLWGTDHSSTGPDHLLTMNLDETRSTYSNETPTELDEFYSAGWATLNGQDKAIYLVTSTDNGYAGGHLAYMDSTGRFALSEALSQTVYSGFENRAKVIDYDRDGDAEIFLTHSDYSDSSVSLSSLPDLTTFWSGSQYSATRANTLLESVDLNGDGLLDMAYVSSSSTLNVVDVSQQIMLSSEVSMDDIINDFKFIDFDGDQDSDVLVATPSELTLWIWNGTRYGLAHTTAKSCISIAAVTGAVGTTQVGCLSSGHDWDDVERLVEFTLDVSGFTETRASSMNYPAVDIVPFSLTNHEAAWLLASQVPPGNSNGGFHGGSTQLQLRSIGSHEVQWSSRFLLGQPRKGSLAVRDEDDTPDGGARVQLGTTAAMYQIF